MVLCEAANVMPDGRFNLIGGGIQRVFCPRFPAQVRFALVVQLLSEPAEVGMGTRRLTIRLIDDDGHDLMPVLNSNIEFRDRRDANVLLDLNNLRVSKAGTYTFSILLDNMELQTWPVHFVKVESKPGEGPAPAPPGPIAPPAS